MHIRYFTTLSRTLKRERERKVTEFFWRLCEEKSLSFLRMQESFENVSQERNNFYAKMFFSYLLLAAKVTKLLGARISAGGVWRAYGWTHYRLTPKP